MEQCLEGAESLLAAEVTLGCCHAHRQGTRVCHNSLLSRVLMTGWGQVGVSKEKQSFDGPACDTPSALSTMAAVCMLG